MSSCLNNVTDLHQLTSHNTTSCPTTWRSYRDRRLLWRHFNLSILRRGWVYPVARNKKKCFTSLPLATAVAEFGHGYSLFCVAGRSSGGFFETCSIDLRPIEDRTLRVSVHPPWLGRSAKQLIKFLSTMISVRLILIRNVRSRRMTQLWGWSLISL